MQSEKCKCKVRTGFIKHIRLSGGHDRADLFMPLLSVISHTVTLVN